MKVVATSRQTKKGETMKKYFCDNCGDEMETESKQLRFFTDKDLCDKCYDYIKDYCQKETDKIRAKIKQGFTIP